MDMNLKSFNQYCEHKNRVFEKTEELKAALYQVQQSLKDTQAQYASTFGTGSDTTTLSKQLSTIKQRESDLQSELELVSNSDLRLKKLASDLYSEFQEVEKNVINTRNAVITEAQDLIESSKKRLQELQEVYHRHADELQSQGGRQMLSALSDLDLRNDLKDSIRLRMRTLGLAERFPTIS